MFCKLSTSGYFNVNDKNSVEYLSISAFGKSPGSLHSNGMDTRDNVPTKDSFPTCLGLKESNDGKSMHITHTMDSRHISACIFTQDYRAFADAYKQLIHARYRKDQTLDIYIKDDARDDRRRIESLVEDTWR